MGSGPFWIPEGWYVGMLYITKCMYVVIYSGWNDDSDVDKIPYLFKLYYKRNKTRSFFTYFKNRMNNKNKVLQKWNSH